MTIKIVILFLSVVILIITICILEYNKNVAEGKSENAEGLSLEILDRYHTLLDKYDELLETVKKIDSKTEIMELHLLNIMQNDVSKDKFHNSENMDCNSDFSAGSNIGKTPETINEIPEKQSHYSTISKTAYDDACTAFHKINCDLYVLRKHREISHALLELLYNGYGLFSNNLLVGLDDKGRENTTSLVSKIKIFNENYRPQLESWLKEHNTPWSSAVRFPLNQTFENDWDENLLGYETEEGAPIQRVVSLGYEFPDSPIIGRQKSKVI